MDFFVFLIWEIKDARKERWLMVSKMLTFCDAKGWKY